MQKFTTILFLLITSQILFAQKNPTLEAQPIVEEGIRLYKSEMASWYGTDLFLEEYENKANIGGYFSYTELEKSRCVFFSKEEKPIVIGTITFDETFSTKTAKINLEERKFSTLESDLHQIRANATVTVQNDTLFKVYNNTSLNLIPLIHDGEKKVYILTGPKVSNVVVFGNDYLITFDENNQVTSKKVLHANIIPISYGEGEDGKEEVGAMHSHLPETGDFITATDICTLMLYSKFTDWKTHNVVSEKYLNIWNCETNTLNVISMDVLRKIDKDQDKRKKKEKKKNKRKKN